MSGAARGDGGDRASGRTAAAATRGDAAPGGTQISSIVPAPGDSGASAFAEAASSRDAPTVVPGSRMPPSERLARLHGVESDGQLADRLAAWQQAATIDGSAPRFELDGMLGQGAQGMVVSVIDRDTRRRIAVKALKGPRCDADDISRFIHEAQVTAQLEHPGIVPVHDLAILADGTLVYAMKRVEGQSLDAHLRGRAGEPAERFDLLQVLLKILDALAFAHSRGVVHRDIKPKNIMVGAYGEVLVMDWGLAKVVGMPGAEATGAPPEPEAPPQAARSGTDGDADRGASGTVPAPGGKARYESSTIRITSYRTETAVVDDIHRTLQGFAVGTPAYMSPEQARGDQRAVDQRSDLYAIGVILYEILVAASPYLPGSVDDTLLQVAQGRTIPIERQPQGHAVPRPLAAIARKAMALDPAGRYQNAEAFAADLRAFLAGLAVSAHAETAAERCLRLYRRHARTVQLAAAGLALAAAGVGGLLWHQASRTEDAIAQLRQEAAAFEREGQLAQARDRYERILGLRAADAQAVQNRGRLDARLAAEAEAARAAADRAASAQLIGRARVLAGQDDERALQDAADLASQAQQLAPGDPVPVELKQDIRLRLAELRRGAEAAAREREAAALESQAASADLDEAVRLVQAAVNLASTPARQATLQRLVGDQAVRREQERQAAREAEREAAARFRRANADQALAEAEAAAVADRGRQAQAAYERAVGIEPGHPELGRVARAVAEALSRERAATADRLRAEAASRLAHAADLAQRIAGAEDAIAELRRRLSEGAEGDVRTRLGAAERDREHHLADRAHALAEGVGALQRALAVAPDHPPVRADLAAFHLDRLREAEAAGDPAGAAAAAAQLQVFADPGEPTVALVLSGSVVVRAEPGSEPLAIRRLESGPDRRLAPIGAPVSIAPGASATVPAGRYQVQAGAAICARRFDRRGATYAIALPAVPALPPGVAYVPAGEIFTPEGRSLGRVAAFAIARFEVTCGEWLEFLNDPRTLAAYAQHRANARGALILAPRDAIDATEPMWLQDPSPPWQRWQTGFRLRAGVLDGPSVAIDPRTPVTGISAEDADAYVAWRRARDGQPWRLPSEREWMLAAQGGDGRAHPWGDAADPGFCHGAQSADRAGIAGPAPSGRFPADASVHGVMDLAGSVAEIVATAPGQARRSACGGSFADLQRDRFTAWSRREFEPRMVSIARGLRLALDPP